MNLRAEKARAAHANLIETWTEDFVGFAAELDVIDKDGDRIPIRPTPILSAFEDERTGWDIVLKPRQIFFTTWELARDLHYFLTVPNANVVVICQSDKDNVVVKELSARVRVMLGFDVEAVERVERKLGLLGKHPELDIEERSETSWRFGTARLVIRGAGATKVAAEKKHRGATVHRMHITEMSSFEYASEMWKSLLESVPRSNDRAEMVIESTPRGAGGLFYRLYQGAKKRLGSFKSHFFRWLSQREYRMRLAPGEKIRPQTPRERELATKHKASAEQIKWYRAKCADADSQDAINQEYPLDEETCWISGGRLYFHKARIAELLTLTTDPIRTETLATSVADPSIEPRLLVWEEPKRRDEYVLIADPSEGVIGGDPCAAAIYHRESGRHVASIHGLWRTHEFAAVLDTVGRRYNDAMIVVERANHGHAVLNALLRLEVRRDNDTPREPYPHVFHDEDEKAGWKTGQVPRATAVESFEAAVRSGEWESPDRDALNEMQRFILSKTGKPEAPPGEHDDRVLVHVIGWRVLSRPITQSPSTGDQSGYRYGSQEGRGFY